MKENINEKVVTFDEHPFKCICKEQSPYFCIITEPNPFYGHDSNILFSSLNASKNNILKNQFALFSKIFSYLLQDI